LNISDNLADMHCQVFRGTDWAALDVKAVTLQGEAVPVWHSKAVLHAVRLRLKLGTLRLDLV
jgi:hypothetical protein